MRQECLSGSFYNTSLFSSKKGENIMISSGFQKVLNQSTDYILKRALFLETGCTELQVRQVSSALKTEISDVFSEALMGVNSESDEGKRVRVGLRPILESLLQDPLLRSLHHDSYLNLLYTSILLARDPSLFGELTISTGFGGSNDADTNIRVPSYIIPGLKILENLRTLKQKNIIDFELPKFRIFFAPYSAIAVNAAEMSSEDVLQNMARTHDYILRYIAFFHRDVASNIYFEIENPWDQHNSVTEAVLTYFSQLLITSQDENVQRSLSILQKRGKIHGNEDGARLSYVYAAMHSLLFKDSINHPPVNVFDNEEKSVFALSIGGRPERLFNNLRSYIRRNAQMTSLSDIMTKEGAASSLTNTSSRKEVKVLNSSIFPIKPDYLSSPVTSVLAITTVGRTPVYYRTKYDFGIRSYNDSPLSYIASKRKAICNNLSGEEKKVELNRLTEVERDIQVIIDDVGSEQILMDFLGSFSN